MGGRSWSRSGRDVQTAMSYEEVDVKLRRTLGLVLPAVVVLVLGATVVAAQIDRVTMTIDGLA